MYPDHSFSKSLPTSVAVVVFVTLPGEKRYALIGDLVWQLEGISEREERPWLQRSIADADPEGVRTNLLRVAAMAAKYPQITIVPAHDLRIEQETSPLLRECPACHAAPRQRCTPLWGGRRNLKSYHASRIEETK